MSVESMTGFARATVEADGIHYAWELKSVNGKGLDMRLRLPSGFEGLEQRARQRIQAGFVRGNIQAVLAVSGGAAGVPAMVVNEAFLKDVAELAQRLQAQYGAAPASADGLLALKGVLQQVETVDDEEAASGRNEAVLACLDEALAALKLTRRQEGEELRRLLSGHFDRIAELTERAEADPSRSLPAIRERLSAQVRLLLEASPPLDEDRLHAEAAFLATKADIREEIDRLRTHVASARALLAAGGAIGRRLDFLSQEFNREANTLCSKSNAAAVTAIGLELKTVIDQFREQVQNLE